MLFRTLANSNRTLSSWARIGIDEMPITPQHFNVLYHRMLEPKPDRFHIAADTSDDWGIVITRRAVSGVLIWHSIKKSTLTLGLTTPEIRNKIPTQSVPPGGTEEVSPAGWRMFRWSVPKIDKTIEPQRQPGMADVVQVIHDAFAWVKSNRIDLK